MSEENSEVVWRLPEPLSVRSVAVDEETSILVRRHGDPDGLRLVFSHGSGLAADLYYPYWSLLTDEFDVIVYDLRNHGWNEATALNNHNVPTLITDHDRIMRSIDAIFGEKPKVGVFHSLSALVSLLSPLNGSPFSALIFFDPPMCKPGRNHREFEAAATIISESARRRQDKFEAYEELAELLSRLPSFQKLVPGVFDLMARTTLRASENKDGFELRCPRDYEALMANYAGVYSVSPDFSKLECPVKVLGADPTMPFSYLPTLDLSGMISVDYDFLPGASHFLPLERPHECAAVSKEFLTSVGLL